MIEPRTATVTTLGRLPAFQRRLAALLRGIFGRSQHIGARWWLLWLGFLLILSGAVSVSHGVDAMWDLKNYHLYNPFQAYHRRYTSDVAPGQVQSYLNPLLDYPFYIAVSLFNIHPRIIAFCMGLPQGLNLWFVSILAWRFSSGQARAARTALTGLAVVIGGTGAGTLPLIGSTTGDVMVTVPTLASLVFFLRGVNRTGRRDVTPHRAFLFAGFLSGAAVGAKPTMACYAVGLFAALLVAVPFRDLLGALLRLTGTVVLGLLTTGAYHGIRMLRLFGSPLFPLFNDVFRSPFFEPAAPRDARFVPKTVVEALFYPFGWATDAHRTFVSEIPFRDIRIALELSLIALVALTAVCMVLTGRNDRQTAPRMTVALLVFIVVSYGLWLAIFSVYRYLLPLEMLSGVLVMVGLRYLALPSAVLPLMVAAAAACWATTIPLEWGHTAFRNHYVEVYAPSLASNTLVLIVGDDPISFLVPFMDLSAQWLSLDNNFLNPSQGNLLVGRERDTIASHRGPMMVLAAAAKLNHASSILSAFGVSADLADCGKVSSNLGSETYQLCPVQREFQ